MRYAIKNGDQLPLPLDIKENGLSFARGGEGERHCYTDFPVCSLTSSRIFSGRFINECRHFELTGTKIKRKMSFFSFHFVFASV